MSRTMGVGRLVVTASIAAILAGCTGDETTPSDTTPQGTPAASPLVAGPSPAFTRFVDVTDQTGIDLTRDNGFDGRRWRIVETVNGGVALLDYDRDGRIDIYFTNGRKLEPGAEPPRNALYRNLGGWRFEDVSRRSATDDAALSLGCAVADFDGDSRAWVCSILDR